MTADLHPASPDATSSRIRRSSSSTFSGGSVSRPVVRDIVAELEVSQSVRFLGPRDDAPELLALSDVVVLPSVVAEGLPTVLLEALALGKPVVATRVGGFPEIIENGRAGLLVPPRDPVALADAACTILSDPACAKSMGEEGRQVVRGRFSAERMVREVERLYLDLAATKGIL